MSEVKLKIRVDKIYGRFLLYPECDTSRLLCKIMNRTTIPLSRVDFIKDLGYIFDVNITDS